MKNNKRLVANIIICLIIATVTLVTFFVGFSKGERTSFDYASLIFVMISEFALFAGLILLSVNSAYMKTALIRSGIITALSGYWILTTLVSLFFRVIFNDNLGGFITVQIIIMGITAIICITLFIVSSNVQSSNNNISQQNYLHDGENIAFSLKSNVEFQSYRNHLDELYEILKYSDKISTNAALDREINNKITLLSSYLNDKEMKEVEVNQYIDNIISMIKERNMITLQAKRGGY
ncbi:hypothetical protein KQI88_00595 [Alkaliphilus sp. MSJ-5]|uniref:Uncharacterized protein n=1 Tax=Alkaliphilus flagellatus TaxID=2841507 RepID=A0ABS6FZL6_9FIRM|nr:hypothetical protein [Alkaliphilus flagellatus]MBU5674912.1 hypothetical protein [Alkaliphilus flagellatus]